MERSTRVSLACAVPFEAGTLDAMLAVSKPAMAYCYPLTARRLGMAEQVQMQMAELALMRHWCASGSVRLLMGQAELRQSKQSPVG